MLFRNIICSYCIFYEIHYNNTKPIIYNGKKFNREYVRIK